jgi:hypothetical protein
MHTALMIPVYETPYKILFQYLRVRYMFCVKIYQITFPNALLALLWPVIPCRILWEVVSRRVNEILYANLCKIAPLIKCVIHIFFFCNLLGQEPALSAMRSDGFCMMLSSPPQWVFRASFVKTFSGFKRQTSCNPLPLRTVVRMECDVHVYHRTELLGCWRKQTCKWRP